MTKLSHKVCLLLSSIAGLSNALRFGSEAPANAAPYAVALLSPNDPGENFHNCSGVLITPKTIITTASCVQDESIHTLQARIGSNDRSTGGSIVGLSKITQHPGFDAATHDYDIAVLSLKEENNTPLATLGDFTSTIGAGLTMYGWGLLNYSDSAMPKKLQKLDSIGVTHEWCAQEWEGRNGITERMVCDWPPTESASWIGDRGGPVVSRLDGSVVGLISFSIVDTNLMKAVPDVHVNLEFFRDWIVENTEA